MSSPYYIVICRTCKLAHYPPSDRGPFYTGLEDFIVDYHVKQGHDCEKWFDETLHSYRDDGKLYQEGGYGDDTVVIEDWYAYGQITWGECEWRNWPERNAKTTKYLNEHGLIDRDGRAVKIEKSSDV